jgi:hypothetical protein
VLGTKGIRRGGRKRKNGKKLTNGPHQSVAHLNFDVPVPNRKHVAPVLSQPNRK